MGERSYILSIPRLFRVEFCMSCCDVSGRRDSKFKFYLNYLRLSELNLEPTLVTSASKEQPRLSSTALY